MRAREGPSRGLAPRGDLLSGVEQQTARGLQSGHPKWVSSDVTAVRLRSSTRSKFKQTQVNLFFSIIFYQFLGLFSQHNFFPLNLCQVVQENLKMKD
jgi:hypothetical protein